jgi:hypothetical protein
LTSIHIICRNINGTFFENRYDLNKSVHLQNIFFNKACLLKEWMNGQKIQKNSSVGNKHKTYSVEDTDNLVLT